MKNMNLFFAIANLNIGENAAKFDAYYNFSNEPQKLEIKKEAYSAFRIYIISDPKKAAHIFRYITEQKSEITEALYLKPSFYKIENKACLDWTNHKTYDALMNLFSEEEQKHIFKACDNFNKTFLGNRTLADYYLNTGKFKAGDFIRISDEHRYYYGKIIRTANNSPIYFIHASGAIDILLQTDSFTLATEIEKENIDSLNKASEKYALNIDTKYLKSINKADAKALEAKAKAEAKAKEEAKAEAEKEAKKFKAAFLKLEKAEQKTSFKLDLNTSSDASIIEAKAKAKADAKAAKEAFKNSFLEAYTKADAKTKAEAKAYLIALEKEIALEASKALETAKAEAEATKAKADAKAEAKAKADAKAKAEAKAKADAKAKEEAKK
jgi:hypothetical protein